MTQPVVLADAHGGDLALWWVGNAVLFFVVLPVVIALLNRLLIPVIRIRRAAEEILDGGVHLMNQVAPVPGLLAVTDETVAAVAQGAVRYAGSAAVLLPPKEPDPPPATPAPVQAEVEAVGTEA
jgi:hypothetical protein